MLEMSKLIFRARLRRT